MILEPKSKKGPKLYQDDIYETKVLSPLAIAVMDTPEFQRLEGIKQLGFAYTSYRGATHNRLAHCVGTHFMCKTLLRRIEQNHERIFPREDNPGKRLADQFFQLPLNANVDRGTFPETPHTKWRGMSEVVSIAALIHDITHVPFGHTLEDEFLGIYERHDSLASQRLYRMLFDERSDMAKVFVEYEPWLEKMDNETLRRLIYVILSYKEDIGDNWQTSFEDLIKTELEKVGGKAKAGDGAVENLCVWYKDFSKRHLFEPFMSDLVSNTICADLLDYLTRDRQHLGMEPRFHRRLQRYLVIRQGTLFTDEGRRMTILVRRVEKGGQRRDVATTILDLMRERYEMAERVFFHHKKAAASTMLAKLIDIAEDKKPRDDAQVYPAPWTESFEPESIPHLLHLSDDEILNYLGNIALKRKGYSSLQRTLYTGIKYRRLYRTLLVVDTDLATKGPNEVTSFTERLWGSKGKSKKTLDALSNRRELERKMADLAGVPYGSVLVYCPPPTMQSKEVDARVEIDEGKIRPLRQQRGQFTLKGDIDTLKNYYQALWRMYIFVRPDIYENDAACLEILKHFGKSFGLRMDEVYEKVRKPSIQNMRDRSKVVEQKLARSLKSIKGFAVDAIPPEVTARVVDLVRSNGLLETHELAGDFDKRMEVLLAIAAIEVESEKEKIVGEVRSLLSEDRREVPKRLKSEIAEYSKRLKRGEELQTLPVERPTGPKMSWDEFINGLAHGIANLISTGKEN